MLDLLARSLWFGAAWGLWALLAAPRRPGSTGWQHAWSAIKAALVAAALGIAAAALYSLMTPTIRSDDDEPECARLPAIYGC